MRLSLWTQGQYACDIYRQLLPYISHFYIYLPAANEERFIAVSGQAKFKEMDLVVDYLKEQQKKVTISHLVTPDNIEFLPEVYEYSYQKNLPLLLHYRKASLFSKESIGFIKRFRRVPGVTVYEGTENEFLCLAVPYGADRRVFQFFRRCWSQLIKLVTVKLGR